MGWLSSAWKEVKRGASSLGKEIKRAGSKIVRFGKKVVKGIGKVMGELGPLGTMALSMMAPWAVGILQGMGGWVGTLGNFAAAVGNTVAAPFQALGQAAGKVVGDIGGALASNISNETVSQGVMKITESLQTALGYEGGTVSENVSKIANSVSDDWGKVFHVGEGGPTILKAPVQTDPSKAKIAEKAGTGVGVKGDATVPRPGEAPKDFRAIAREPVPLEGGLTTPSLEDISKDKLYMNRDIAPYTMEPLSLDEGVTYDVPTDPAYLDSMEVGKAAPSPEEYAGMIDKDVMKPKKDWTDRVWDAAKKTWLPGPAQAGAGGQTTIYKNSVTIPEVSYPTIGTGGAYGGGFFQRPRPAARMPFGTRRTGFMTPQY